jgi:hypothetical protein
MINMLSNHEIFASPFGDKITLMKYNIHETEDYLPGMVPIGQVEYDRIDDAVTNPQIDLNNDTLTTDDKAVLKAFFNL